MSDLKITRDVRSWVHKRAAEIAKEEIEHEGRAPWETVDEAVRLRLAKDPFTYTIEAILDYLSELERK